MGIRDLFRSPRSEELSPKETIAAEAAAIASVGVLVQLSLCYLRNASDEPVDINSEAGDPKAIAYIKGFAKAAHLEFESTSGQHINDANLLLATLQSVFRANSIDQCVGANNRAIKALDADEEGVRDAFSLGKSDYVIARHGSESPSGLVAILGVGRNK